MRGEMFSNNTISGDGKQTLGPVEPGAYKMILSLKSDRYDERPISSTPIALAVLVANTAAVPLLTACL